MTAERSSTGTAEALPLVGRLRSRSRLVFLAADASPAQDMSDHFIEASDEIERLHTERDSLITCVQAALNMVDGDGMPPDWDFLRKTLSQVQP